MSTCHCGSGATLETCCLPYIRGEAELPTVEAAIRSRYSAFVMGEVDYILQTHHSETRDLIDPAEVERWSRSSEWLGLEIFDTSDGLESDDEGIVNFAARYRLDGKLHDHREESLFRREDGAWRFYSAEEFLPPGPELVPVVASSTIGRNDPCHCGSGIKYKKCHGAVA